MIGLCLPGMPGRHGVVVRGAERRVAHALDRKGAAHYIEVLGVIQPTRTAFAAAIVLHATGRAAQHAADLIASLSAEQAHEPPDV